jgi:hypothetical protein
MFVQGGSGFTGKGQWNSRRAVSLSQKRVREETGVLQTYNVVLQNFM